MRKDKPGNNLEQNFRRQIVMNAYVASVIEYVKKRHANEPEFVQMQVAIW